MFQRRLHLTMHFSRVIAISSVRVFLVVRGQWETDQSWVYDPFLAIENAEIGGTLIALCIPALKPVVGKLSTRISSSYFSSKGYLGSSRTPKDEKLIKVQRNNDGYEMSEPYKVLSDSRLNGLGTEEVLVGGNRGIMKRTEVQTTVVERGEV